MIITIALGIVLAVIILAFLPAILAVIVGSLAIIFSPKEPLTEQELKKQQEIVREQEIIKEQQIKQSIIDKKIRKAKQKESNKIFFRFIKLCCLLSLGFYLQLLSLEDGSFKEKILLVFISFLFSGYFFYYYIKHIKSKNGIGSIEFRYIILIIIILVYIPWMLLIISNIFN